MGYFSNGAEGGDYHAQWCSRCVHDVEENCPVWLAHLIHNYSECNNEESILHLLIPRSESGLDNEQCRLFWPIEEGT